jgi:hypothetical protein
MSREVRKTEDPNGSILTVDTFEECGSPVPTNPAIRRWSADFKLLGVWCFECKKFHDVGAS